MKNNTYTHEIALFPGEDSGLCNLGEEALYEKEHEIMSRKEITTRYLCNVIYITDTPQT